MHVARGVLFLAEEHGVFWYQYVKMDHEAIKALGDVGATYSTA